MCRDSHIFGSLRTFWLLAHNQKGFSMPSTTQSLLKKRAQILAAMDSLGPFRRGTVTVQYRKCGKAMCRCAAPGARGHGPRHLWSATIDGKSVAEHLSTPEEVRRCEEQTAAYKEYGRLSAEFVSVNEQLCALAPEGPSRWREDEASKKNGRRDRGGVRAGGRAIDDGLGAVTGERRSGFRGVRVDGALIDALVRRSIDRAPDQCRGGGGGRPDGRLSGRPSRTFVRDARKGRAVGARSDADRSRVLP